MMVLWLLHVVIPGELFYASAIELDVENLFKTRLFYCDPNCLLVDLRKTDAKENLITSIQ